MNTGVSTSASTSADTSTKKNRDTLFLIAAAAVVLVSRLPFLNAGYGTDPDGWRVANVARAIALTGKYSASRLPGYPLPELLSSLIWKGGPVALNGISALLSTVAFAFFALSLRALKSREFILGGLALAFTPVVFINSTTSMDYVWALAFILGSLYFVLQRKPLVAGVFLGLAIGCRITSGAMLLPLSVILVHQDGKLSIRRVINLCLVSCSIGLIAFSPVLFKYGSGFFTFTKPMNPEFLIVARNATTSVWGVLGSLAILLSVISLPAFSRKERSIPASVGKSSVVAWILSLCLYAIAFSRLPEDAGFLVPAVPFAILLLGRLLDRRIFTIVCAAIIVSSFAFWVGRGGIDYRGPIFRDHARRIEDTNLIRQVILFGRGTDQKSVVVAGAFLPFIEEGLHSDSVGVVKYVYLLDTPRLDDYLERGFNLYYLPGQNEFNLAVYRVDLARKGAQEFNAGPR